MKKRLNYIDIYKGIGIVLMILGHIFFEPLFRKIIYSFHMPMFFFVSGYLYSSKYTQNKTSHFIKKKAKSLLIPYISFGIIHYCIWGLFNYNNLTLAPLINLFFINTDGLVIETALWFLTAIFFTEIIYFLIDKYLCKNKVLKTILIIALSIIGILIPTLSSIRLPLGLDCGLVGLSFFYSGIHIRELENNTKNKIVNLKLYEIIIASIILLGLILVNGTINMQKGQYCIIPLFWINAFGISILILNLVKIIEKWNKKTIKIITKFLSKIGENSIIYVCLNHITILISTALINVIHFPSLISKLLIPSIVIIILYLAEIIINKTSLKKLFGKF